MAPKSCPQAEPSFAPEVPLLDAEGEASQLGGPLAPGGQKRRGEEAP